MTTHFFLLSDRISLERVSWIEESLKFFFVQLYPETLTHRAPAGSPIFVLLLTGDALYSLEDPETEPVWSVILSLAPVRLICDRQELDLRGITIERLKMKSPDQVIDTNSLTAANQPSFWQDVAGLVRQNRSALPDSIGWLQNESPYMHRSAEYGLRLLQAGIETRLSPELYTNLDGIHMGHTGQKTAESENIGTWLEILHDCAGKAGLTSLFLACDRCASARGYSTWDDGKGAVISTCAIKPFHIRDMNAMVDRFCRPHIILAANAGSIQFAKRSPGLSFDRIDKNSAVPPVTILVTKSPYSTEHVYGAISFAAACAHQGILTRVIFMEDGVLSVAGNHRPHVESIPFSIPDLINAVAGNDNLHFFVLQTSLQKRGLIKNPGLNAVIDIGFPGLGKILFYPPGTVNAEHQRVLIF